MGAGVTDLSDEEIAIIRRILQHADTIDAVMKYSEEIVAHAELKAAQRLIYSTWRGFVIGIAGLIGAGYVLKDWLGKFLSWGSGQ